MSYERPQPLALDGMSGVSTVMGWLGKGFRLTGGPTDLGEHACARARATHGPHLHCSGTGFLFCYELLTGTVRWVIQTTDSPRFVVDLLSRMLPPKALRGRAAARGA